jgi:hypothetical protein
MSRFKHTGGADGSSYMFSLADAELRKNQPASLTSNKGGIDDGGNNGAPSSSEAGEQKVDNHKAGEAASSPVRGSTSGSPGRGNGLPKAQQGREPYTQRSQRSSARGPTPYVVAAATESVINSPNVPTLLQSRVIWTPTRHDVYARPMRPGNSSRHYQPKNLPEDPLDFIFSSPRHADDTNNIDLADFAHWKTLPTDPNQNRPPPPRPRPVGGYVSLVSANTIRVPVYSMMPMHYVRGAAAPQIYYPSMYAASTPEVLGPPLKQGSAIVLSGEHTAISPRLPATKAGSTPRGRSNRPAAAAAAAAAAATATAAAAAAAAEVGPQKPKSSKGLVHLLAVPQVETSNNSPVTSQENTPRNGSAGRAAHSPSP